MCLSRTGSKVPCTSMGDRHQTHLDTLVYTIKYLFASIGTEIPELYTEIALNWIAAFQKITISQVSKENKYVNDDKAVVFAIIPTLIIEGL